MKIIRVGKRRNRKPVRIKKPRPVISKHGYTERNKNLKALGFGCYSEYIKSDMWKMIRKIAFESNGKLCVACGRRATQLHHSSYDLRTLAGSDLTHLHPVCKECHESAEICDGIKSHHKTANSIIGVSTPSPRQQGAERKRIERKEFYQSEKRNQRYKKRLKRPYP